MEHGRRVDDAVVETHGPPQLLMDLALGKVQHSPFEAESLSRLKTEVVSELAARGLQLHRSADDRADLPIDYRFLQLMLTAADDPEVHLWPLRWWSSCWPWGTPA